MAIAKTPTTQGLISEAKTKGYCFKKCGTHNGQAAYRLADANKHGYATGPTGESAALFTKSSIADLLGYQL